MRPRRRGKCLIQGAAPERRLDRLHRVSPPIRRKKFAYRVDGPPVAPVQLDDVRRRQDSGGAPDDDAPRPGARIPRRARPRGDDLRAGERPQGPVSRMGVGPRGTRRPPNPKDFPVLPAKYPETWPRQYPGGDYWVYYTFNDNTVVNTIDALLLAAKVYNDPRFRDAAIRAGGLHPAGTASRPPSPPGRSSTTFAMQPVWARKFEPPAVSGGEIAAAPDDPDGPLRRDRRAPVSWSRSLGHWIT
jgi:hypothetical protein